MMKVMAIKNTRIKLLFTWVAPRTCFYLVGAVLVEAVEAVALVGQRQQRLGQPQPRLGQPQPRLGQPQPRLGQPQPRLGQPQPRLGQAQPRLGQRLRRSWPCWRPSASGLSLKNGSSSLASWSDSVLSQWDSRLCSSSWLCGSPLRVHFCVGKSVLRGH